MRKLGWGTYSFLTCLLAEIALYIVATVYFPIDSNNTLILPDWYTNLMTALPLVCVAVAVVLCNLTTIKSRFEIATTKKTESLRRRTNLTASREALSVESVDTKDETLYIKAVKVVMEAGQASASLLQRRLLIDFLLAKELIDQMVKNSVISEMNNGQPRKILMDVACALQTRPDSLPEQLSQIGDTVDSGRMPTTLQKVDVMEGHEFEYFCADILRKNGFTNVSVTQGSGDQGVDVLAEKDGIKYAIQCKCYASDLGNKPVQEIHAGKTIYRCHIGVVMTNRNFTSGAIAAADATGVLLWDREKLASLIAYAEAVRT